MPKLWADTVDSHRRRVSETILDATARLIAEQGLSVTMSAIAERAGIGRATLYKYFPDVESILVAWHGRDFAHHLNRLRVLSEADDVTLTEVVAFVCRQRRQHPGRRGAHALGPLAHAVAGSAGVARGAAGGTIDRAIVSLLAVVMTRLAGRAEVRTDHDPEVLARWALYAMHAPGGVDDQALAQLLADSLAPPPSQRPTQA